MIFLKIFYGIILIFSGIMVIKYRKIVYEWIGRIDFIEKYLGIGSTITFIILIGLILIFIGVVYPAGYFEFKSSFDNENNDFLINTQNTN